MYGGLGSFFISKSNIWMSQVFSIEPIVMMTTGKITKIRAIFHKCPYIRARLYFYGGLGHTALSLKCKYYHYQWYSCLMEGKGSKKKSGRGVWGAISPLWPRCHPNGSKPLLWKRIVYQTIVGRKKFQKKTNIWPFPAYTYTHKTNIC